MASKTRPFQKVNFEPSRFLDHAAHAHHAVAPNTWDSKCLIAISAFLTLYACLASLATIIILQTINPARFESYHGSSWPMSLPSAAEIQPQRVRKTRAPSRVSPVDAHHLVRETLRQLSLANITNTYSQFHAESAPAFQRANSAQKLRDIFAWMRNKNISLTMRTGLRPFDVRDASIDANGYLNISGLISAQPAAVQFKAAYQDVAGSWKLFGIQVELQR